MSRKYDTLDVVKMRATLTLDHWENVLRRAVKTGNTDKLVMYRYGLQAGLADASAQGLADEALTIWVMKRIKNIEKCMKFIISRRYPNPIPDHRCKTDPNGYIRRGIEAKKKRDRELEKFLQKSAF